MNPQFTLVDWTIVALYLALVLFMGAVISRRQKDSTYFFLGGRSMPGWAVAMSVLATALSAATFIGVPQMAYEGNLTYLVSNIGSVIAAFLIAFFFVPPLYKAGTITIYGFLGKRYGNGARIAAGTMFLLGRMLSSGARLYMAGIALALMIYGTAAPQDLVVAIIVLGLVGTLYTVFGGIRAVIWTDALQLIVLITAAFCAALFLKHMIPVPLHEMYYALRNAHDANKLQLIDTSFSIEKPFTLWSGTLAMIIVALSTHGVDQDMLQRVMTACSPWQGGRALVVSMLAGIPIVALFLCIGLMLYIFYQCPELMGDGAPADVVVDSRRVFPQFVLHHLPTGLRGLTMAGLIAAAMSTFDSAITAMASSIAADLYAPWKTHVMRKPNTEPEMVLPELKQSRIAVALMGALLTAFAIGAVFLQELTGDTLINFALGVMAYALAPLLGVFCAALFTKRGTSYSVYAALVLGALAVLLLQPVMIPRFLGIKPAWTWIWFIVSPISFLICICGSPKKGRTL